MLIVVGFREAGMLSLLFLACGCGDPVGTADAAAPPADAAPDGDPDAGWTVRPPNEPELPALTPCPPGWAERLADGVATCEPWPGGTAHDCGLTSVQLPGTDVCAPIGSDCPSGQFPVDAAGSGHLFVDPSADGGNGDRARPFASLAEALLAAQPGTVIVLSKGTHVAQVPLALAGVELRGACPGETTLTVSPGGEGAVLRVAEGAEATIRDLAIDGALQAGGIEARGSATVMGVSIRRAVGSGIVVFGVLNATDLVVDGGRADATGNAPAVLARNGGAATVSRARFAGQVAMGAASIFDATLNVTDTHVVDTRSRADGLMGRGLHQEGGGRIEALRVVVEGVRDAGASVADDSVLTLTDSVIRDTLSDSAAQANGIGVGAALGARAILRRVLLESLADVGLLIDDRSHMEVRDVVIRDVVPDRGTGRFGRGVNVQYDSSLIAERVAVVRTRDIAVFAKASEITGRDLTVRDSISDAEGYAGRAFELQRRSTVTLERVAVERVDDVGIVTWGDGTTLRGTDLSVATAGGRGWDGEYGRGIDAERGTSMDLERVHVDSVRDLGVAVFGPAARITAAELSVVNTLEKACAGAGCPAAPSGIGLGAYDAGTLDVSSFRVEAAALCGAQVADDGVLRLSTGLVSHNPLGVCVQVDGYDYDQLKEGVSYRDNGAALEAVALPVPEPVPATG